MGFLVVLFGVLNIWCALSDNSAGDPSQGILMVIFLICLVCWFVGKSKEPTNPSYSQNNGKNVTCAISNAVEKSYVAYLQEFSDVAYTIADWQYKRHGSDASELFISVTISKLNDRNCKVHFSVLEHMVILPPNITFGGNIIKDDNDSIRFSAENATGFNNPYDVRNEVVLQLTTHTSHFDIVKKKDEVFTHGDFAFHPFVNCYFEVKYKP